MELPLPRKRGCPPSYKPVSSADRMRAYRQRNRSKRDAMQLHANYDEASDHVLIDQLRKELRSGNAPGIASVCEALMRR
jgi:hypothetical protein